MIGAVDLLTGGKARAGSDWRPNHSSRLRKRHSRSPAARGNGAPGDHSRHGRSRQGLGSVGSMRSLPQSMRTLSPAGKSETPARTEETLARTEERLCGLPPAVPPLDSAAVCSPTPPDVAAEDVHGNEKQIAVVCETDGPADSQQRALDGFREASDEACEHVLSDAVVPGAESTAASHLEFPLEAQPVLVPALSRTSMPRGSNASHVCLKGRYSRSDCSGRSSSTTLSSTFGTPLPTLQSARRSDLTGYAQPDLFHGPPARAAFFGKYEQTTAKMAEQGRNCTVLDSARTQYIRRCNEQLLPPIPLVVASQVAPSSAMPSTASKSHVINFNSRSLGDRQIRAFADGGLPRLAQHGVMVEEIHLAGNSIREAATVRAIGQALSACPALRTLDLSCNCIGRQGAASLAEALEGCPRLEQLVLRKISVDDKATADIFRAIVDHPYLVNVDFAQNELGRTAAAKTVRQEGLTTLSAETLSALIQSSSALQKLDLSWNSLRGPAARRLSMAVEFNKMLSHLELSWNGFGSASAESDLGQPAVEALAEALRGHRWLRYLGLGHNGIRERGAVMLGDMMKENKSLEKVVLDGNPIGIRGGRAILRALHHIGCNGWDRQISITGCNFKCTDPSEEIFDPQNPGGQYRLELHDPYDRFVAWELIHLAWTQEGENWHSEKLDGNPFELPEPGEGELWNRDNFDLPRYGVLELGYISTRKPPRIQDAIGPAMLLSIKKLMLESQGADNIAILRLAATDFFFTAEMIGIFVGMMKDAIAKMHAVECLIARVVDWPNLTQFVYDYLTVGELQMIEKRVGNLFFFTPLNPTGRYRLNLANAGDKAIAAKLVEISSQEEKIRRTQDPPVINTSQKGDWDNWRNERLTTTYKKGNFAADYSEGREFDYDDETPEPLPPHGILELDYISTNVNHRLSGEPPMPTALFEAFVDDLKYVPHTVRVVRRPRPAPRRSMASSSEDSDGTEDQDSSSDSVSTLQNDEQPTDTINQNDNFVKGTQDMEVAIAAASPPARATGSNADQIESVQQAVGRFQAVWRRKQIRKIARLQQASTIQQQARRNRFSIGATQHVGDCYRSEGHKRRLWHAFRRQQEADRRKLLGPQLCEVLTRHSLLPAPYAEENEQDGASASLDDAVDSMGTDPDTTRRAFGFANTSAMHKGRKSASRQCWWVPYQRADATADCPEEKQRIVGTRQLQIIRRATQEYCFSVEQLQKVLGLLPQTVRVDAVVTVFARLTNAAWLQVDNLLNHDQVHELQSRVGSANLFNPIRPERKYLLDLKVHDDREVAKCLVRLSEEPGENFVGEMFGHAVDTMEGFSIGLSWEEEVPMSGFLQCTYRTAPGTASLFLRVAMAQLLLMPGQGQWKAIPEDLRQPDDPAEVDRMAASNAGVSKLVELAADGTLKVTAHSSMKGEKGNPLFCPNLGGSYKDGGTGKNAGPGAPQ